MQEVSQSLNTGDIVLLTGADCNWVALNCSRYLGNIEDFGFLDIDSRYTHCVVAIGGRRACLIDYH